MIPSAFHTDSGQSIWTLPQVGSSTISSLSASTLLCFFLMIASNSSQFRTCGTSSSLLRLISWIDLLPLIPSHLVQEHSHLVLHCGANRRFMSMGIGMEWRKVRQWTIEVNSVTLKLVFDVFLWISFHYKQPVFFCPCLNIGTVIKIGTITGSKCLPPLW